MAVTLVTLVVAFVGLKVAEVEVRVEQSRKKSKSHSKKCIEMLLSAKKLAYQRAGLKIWSSSSNRNLKLLRVKSNVAKRMTEIDQHWSNQESD